MDNGQEIFYAKDRIIWRQWLEANFQTKKLVWLVFPNKSSKIESVAYSDAVEEALCFGWIDSTIRSYEENKTIQRFSIRNPKSTYSQLNIERIVWLYNRNLIHPSVLEFVKPLLDNVFIFPEDIIERLQSDDTVWNNYCQFSDSYKRIRIAYIDIARNYPDEFNKRLEHFILKTKRNKLRYLYTTQHHTILITWCC